MPFAAGSGDREAGRGNSGVGGRGGRGDSQKDDRQPSRRTTDRLVTGPNVSGGGARIEHRGSRQGPSQDTVDQLVLGPNFQSPGFSAEKQQSRFETGQDFGARVLNALVSGFEDSVGAPSGGRLGALGLGIRAVPGVGALYGLTQAFQDLTGIQGVPNFGDPDAEQRDDRDGEILSPAPRQQQQQQQAPSFPWQRPGEMPSQPAGLNLDAGMTPLQQRAAVATGGTQGDAGIYRDPAIMDYYRNLALYTLTQPGGAPADDARVLPIERQYLSQTTGRPAGETVEDFLRALAAR